jgi:hypothetical protein
MVAVHTHRPTTRRDERTGAERPIQARNGAPSGSAPGSFEWRAESAKTEPSTVPGIVIFFFFLEHFLSCCCDPFFRPLGIITSIISGSMFFGPRRQQWTDQKPYGRTIVFLLRSIHTLDGSVAFRLLSLG